MPMDLSKFLKKRSTKKVILVALLFLGLFVICNNVLMPWYVNRGGTLNVPNVIGLKFEDASRLVDSLGLEPRSGGTKLDNQYPAGCVVIQNPIPGSVVKKGRRVYLTISGGEQKVFVPILRGKSVRDAKFSLERNGLKLGNIDNTPSDEFPENTIIDQSIPSGTEVKKNSSISVTVSQGKMTDKITVPNVVGKSFTEAEKFLGEAGLKIGQVTYQSSSILLPNTVVDQFPRSGEIVGYGEKINLFVIKGGEKRKELIEY
jgi:eukaryotic-like serine/threonine-protein kinase